MFCAKLHPRGWPAWSGSVMMCSNILYKQDSISSHFNGSTVHIPKNWLDLSKTTVILKVRLVENVQIFGMTPRLPKSRQSKYLASINLAEIKITATSNSATTGQNSTVWVEQHPDSFGRLNCVHWKANIGAGVGEVCTLNIELDRWPILPPFMKINAHQ